MAVEEGPEEKEEGEETEKPKKAKSKLLIIIIIAVLLLTLLGVGGFIVYKKVLSPPSEDVKKEQAAKEAEEEAATLGLVTPFEPFIVNLQGEAGKRYLKVTMQVELSSAEVSEEVTNKMPQIKDSIITVLSSKATRDLLTIEGKFKLKEEILLRINKLLKRGVVKNVYFVEFVIQ